MKAVRRTLIALVAASALAVLTLSAPASVAHAAPKCRCRISVRPTEGYRGHKLTVKGSGFKPGSSVDLEFIGVAGEHKVLASAHVRRAGTFTLVVAVPRWAGLAHDRIIASDGHQRAVARFLVLFGKNCHVTGPGFKVSPPEVAPGGSVTVSGPLCAGTYARITLRGPNGRRTVLIKSFRIAKSQRFARRVVIPSYTAAGFAVVAVFDASMGGEQQGLGLTIT